jgi:hypothetical protein
MPKSVGDTHRDIQADVAMLAMLASDAVDADKALRAALRAAGHPAPEAGLRAVLFAVLHAGIRPAVARDGGS